MFLASFRQLIEIEALNRDNLVNHENIQSKLKRISDLEGRRNNAFHLIEETKAQEKNLKVPEILYQIEDKQLRLSKLDHQLSLSVTQKEQLAFEAQISTLKTDIGLLEDDYFEKLDQSEVLLEKIRELQVFYAGSEKTLEEIKGEVDKKIIEEKKIISNRQLRIDSLLENCHSSVKKIYLDLLLKFKPKSPVSYLIDKKCSGCHMQLDSQTRSSLDEGRSIECCPTCSRLLIPETAKIYS